MDVVYYLFHNSAFVGDFDITVPAGGSYGNFCCLDYIVLAFIYSSYRIHSAYCAKQRKTIA